jgi:polyferredoxin
MSSDRKKIRNGLLIAIFVFVVAMLMTRLLNEFIPVPFAKGFLGHFGAGLISGFCIVVLVIAFASTKKPDA